MCTSHSDSQKAKKLLGESPLEKLCSDKDGKMRSVLTSLSLILCRFGVHRGPTSVEKATIEHEYHVTVILHILQSKLLKTKLKCP